MGTGTDELQLLSISKAAKILRISKISLIDLINKGKIGVIEIGRRRKIPIHELLRFQQESVVRANTTNNKPMVTDKEVDNFFGTSGFKRSHSLNGNTILQHVMAEEN